MNVLGLIIAGFGGFILGRISQWISDARSAMGTQHRRNARTR